MRLYWRRLHELGPSKIKSHCFKRSPDGDFVSLCDQHRLVNSRGQVVARPPMALRCLVCNSIEMGLHGWRESGRPTKGDWHRYWLDGASSDASIRVVVTDFHAGSGTPYLSVLRTLKDERSDHKLVDLLRGICGAEDGDEVEITMRPTGRRPFGNRRVVLVAPHTYRREGLGLRDE